MSQGRVIISTTTDNVNKHEAVRSHAALLARQFQRFPNNTLRHAIGMFDGEEELSVVIDIPNVPFIALASSAYNLCLKFKQKSVYFSHNGEAFLATAGGEMVRLGKEREGNLTGIPQWYDDQPYTRIIGTEYYIWTVK